MAPEPDDLQAARRQVKARVAAEFCFELGISAKQIQLAGIGEQVSMGSMSVEDAATAILGPAPPAGLTSIGQRSTRRPPATWAAC